MSVREPKPQEYYDDNKRLYEAPFHFNLAFMIEPAARRQLLRRFLSMHPHMSEMRCKLQAHFLFA